MLSNRTVEGRKTVTVLFCDLVAYTELAGRLDPEALRHLMLVFFEHAAAAIEAHGGTVEKFVGDEVMAVFGVPVVHEDDALRAVRAALAVHERVAELDRGSDVHLEVRIGINTGEVVTGDPSAGHGFVSGDAVAVGKRLEQAAAPGEIVLGESTYRLVEHAVHATPLDPLTLKGKSEQASAFRGDWFAGGDLAAFDGDGYLWTHGRADDIMNAGGYRVSPLEVEAALIDCPGVAEVAVGEHLVRAEVSIIAAFVVRREGDTVDAAAILAHAAPRLAAFKRPKQIFFVPALPRSRNGKLLRRALASVIPATDDA